jgi:hypothetical protein
MKNLKKMKMLFNYFDDPLCGSNAGCAVPLLMLSCISPSLGHRNIAHAHN